MTYTNLISTTELAKHLDDPDWAIVDARFVLTAPERAEQNYQRSHIPATEDARGEADPDPAGSSLAETPAQ